LPAIYPDRSSRISAGCCRTEASISENFRRAAGYADRILKARSQASFPSRAPVKFELVINLKAAKALGLDVPAHLQQRADELSSEYGMSAYGGTFRTCRDTLTMSAQRARQTSRCKARLPFLTKTAAAIR